MSDKSILSFSQDADFYLRAGRKKVEEGNLISALSKIRKAYELDPTSTENIISLAELLNRMQRFEESARILLLSGSPNTMNSDALFGLASDFLGMEEFIPAKHCFLMYLSKFPGGTYANSCKDYLSLFEDKEEFSWQLGLDEGESADLIQHIHISKALHFSNMDQKCLEYLLSLQKEFPDSLWLQMEIALAEFFLRENRAAEFRAINILKKDPEYVRAKCLLAYIRLSKNKKLEAVEILNGIKVPSEPDLEALGMLSSAFLETGLYEKAENSTQIMLSYLPYDPLSIHQAAFAKYMLGKSDAAINLYRSILEMDPHDSVASYYINWISTHPDCSKGAKGFLTSYDVSYSEAVSRLFTIAHIFDNGIEEAKQKWEKDRSLYDLFKWALASPFVPEKKTAFYELTALRGERAIGLLRSFLLKSDQSDDDKRHAFSALQLLNYTKPLPIYYNGGWRFEVCCATVEDNVPPAYERIKKELEDLADDPNLGPETVNIALRFFDFYMQALQGDYPRINMFQREALVAAIIYIALETQQRGKSLESIAAYFKVSTRRLDNALNKLMYYLSDDSDKSEE